MVIYIFELLAIFLAAVLTKKIKLKNSDKTFIIFSFFIIIVIASLRKYTVGIDLEGQYARTYTMMANMDWGSAFQLRYEPGYVVFCKLLSRISADPQFYIFITSLITFGCTGYFFYKNSEDVRMSTILFITFNYMFNYMNIIRQALALSIIMLGTELLKRKKYLLFALIVVLAAFIHSSAIIMLILIPFSRIKYRKLYIYICFIFFGLSLIWGKYAFTLSEFLLSKYEGYETKENLGTSVINTYTIVVSVFMLAIFLMANIFLTKNNSPEKGIKKVNKTGRIIKIYFSENRILTLGNAAEEFSNHFLLFMVFFATVFRISVFSVTILGRLLVYFQPFVLLSIPVILNNISNSRRNKLIYKYLMYLLSLGYFIYTAMHTSAGNFGTIPYSFFWQ